MMKNNVGGWALAGVLCAAGGCTLTLDYTNKQCSTDDDCKNLAGSRETYLCNAGVCQHPLCETDADCRPDDADASDPFATAICEPDRKLGNQLACLPGRCTKSSDCRGEEVCNTELNRCSVASKALCTSGADEECAPYDGLPVCLSERCVSSQCVTDEDCIGMEGMLATATCTGTGKCVDEIWGCAGEPDDREAVSGTGSLEMVVIDARTNEMPADLKVILCGPLNDFECTNNPDGVVKLDHDKSILRITGLKQHQDVRLRLTATGVYDTEFYSQQTILGKKNTEPPLVLLSPEILPPLQAVTGIEPDVVNNGTLLTRALTCAGELAEGLTVRVGRPLVVGGVNSTRYFYLNSSFAPIFGGSVTDASGFAGAVNLGAGMQTTVTLGLSGSNVLTGTLITNEGWITVGNLYPRDFDR